MSERRSIGLKQSSTKYRFCIWFSVILIVTIIGFVGTYFFTILTSQYALLSARRIPFEKKFTTPPNPLLQNRIATSSKQYAFTACSIHSSTQAYCFYTPLIALAWHRLNYTLVVIFVGDFRKLSETKLPYIRLAKKYVTQLGGLTLDFQCPEEFAVKISQIIRIFIGFLPLSFLTDDDFLITTDSDLIPLRPEQYMLRLGYPDGFILNRFCCGLFQRRNRTYHMVPMGHIYLKRSVWRAVILESVIQKELIDIDRKRDEHPVGSYEDQLVRNYSNGFSSLLLNEQQFVSFETISLYLRHEFRNVYYQPMGKGDAAWEMDQILVTMILTDYRNTTINGQNLKIDERNLLPRLDREQPLIKWSKYTNYSHFGDAHCTHTIFQDNFWPIFLRMFRTMFNETIIQLLHEYATAHLTVALDWLS